MATMKLTRRISKGIVIASINLPNRPMNAESTRDASGSAASASNAGKAMTTISCRNSSALNAFLAKENKQYLSQCYRNINK